MFLKKDQNKSGIMQELYLSYSLFCANFQEPRDKYLPLTTKPYKQVL